MREGKSIKDIVTLNIFVKLYQNTSINVGTKAIDDKVYCLKTATVTLKC